MRRRGVGNFVLYIKKLEFRYNRRKNLDETVYRTLVEFIK